MRLPRAGHALQRIQHINIGVIGDVVGVVPVAAREYRDQHHDRRRFLLHRHALLRDGGRKLRQRKIHAVLHLHLRDVGIRVEREIDGQNELSVSGARRRHVDHVVDAVDLRLDRSGNRLRDGARIGTGIVRLHGDLNRRDRWILLYGQDAHRHTAGDDDEDCNDRGEDRPLDEETRKHQAAPLKGR